MSTHHSGKYEARRAQIAAGLAKFEAAEGMCHGLVEPTWRTVLVEQMISSLRRIEYVEAIRQRPISDHRPDPHSPNFDPLKGASWLERRGHINDAVWLVFIATHFGKHAIDGWKLTANVYGSFGAGPRWMLNVYSSDPSAFLNMLKANGEALRDKHQSGRYSNHRQYQPKSPEGIAQVFSSFYEWQMAEGGLGNRIRCVHKKRGQHPSEVFDELFHSLDDVQGFGRLGKFDLLTMLAKLQLAPIEAGSVYLSGATGPLAGAKLLIHGDREAKAAPKSLGQKIDRLDEYIAIGKQAIEDGLCNWQKRPQSYEYFKG